jgi:hypothetical protein
VAHYLTFQELLACIFLEECFVSNRTVEIVKHKFENGLDLLFRIIGEMGQGGVLRAKD